MNILIKKYEKHPHPFFFLFQIKVVYSISEVRTVENYQHGQIAQKYMPSWSVQIAEL